MAYANNFQTIVTGLRFKCFVWTSDLFKMGVFCDFNIYEKEPQNLIDFEIVVKIQMVESLTEQDTTIFLSTSKQFTWLAI